MSDQAHPSPISLRGYQEYDVSRIIGTIRSQGPQYRFIYQLPTGGGKTVIFAEIARRYIESFHRKVLILTHRKELIAQTRKTLQQSGIDAMLITSEVKDIPRIDSAWCYLAMVETLNNRLKEDVFYAGNIGLVIVDEAHNNAFTKVLEQLDNAVWLGVTATPVSSNPEIPLNEVYHEVITGEPISELVAAGYLSKPELHTYHVELDSLIVGSHGEFTAGSSDLLYSSPAMLKLLQQAYENHCNRKKTLIFNNGIDTSLKVKETFEEAGIPVKHLDNHASAKERQEILSWFRKTPDAVLTSVSILTTGFDEPSIQSVILYRATNSIALYFQMVGRGSRKTSRKKTFTIVDLGNNTDRFGQWEEAVDWHALFGNPDAWHEDRKEKSVTSSKMKGELREKFANTLETGFDFEQAFTRSESAGVKSREILQSSIRQHVIMCIENARDAAHALELADELQPEIAYRVKKYTSLLEKPTPSYRKWLEDDYAARIKEMLGKYFTGRQ